MGCIFAHKAYEAALWELDKLPAFLDAEEISLRTVVQRHNLMYK